MGAGSSHFKLFLTSLLLGVISLRLLKVASWILPSSRTILEALGSHQIQAAAFAPHGKVSTPLKDFLDPVNGGKTAPAQR